jgi:hypothetical protein
MNIAFTVAGFTGCERSAGGGGRKRRPQPARMDTAPPAPARPTLAGEVPLFMRLEREVEEEFRPQMRDALQRKVDEVAACNYLLRRSLPCASSFAPVTNSSKTTSPSVLRSETFWHDVFGKRREFYPPRNAGANYGLEEADTLLRLRGSPFRATGRN